MAHRLSKGLVVGLLAALAAAGCGDSNDQDEPSGEGGAAGASGAAGATADASAGTAGSSGSGPTSFADCFESREGGVGGPDYDQFGPTIGSHCLGTNHQDIQGVQRLVFLGDSVTAGTPPTPVAEYYRNVLARKLEGSFGSGLQVDDCSKYGARTDDFLQGKKEIQECFGDLFSGDTPLEVAAGGVDDRATLVVFTIGGNDISAWAMAKLGEAEALAEVDKAAGLLDDAIAFFEEPGRFPNGIYVVYANPYEYTDATGDLFSCPAAVLGGLEGNWIEGAPAVIAFQERFMEIAVTRKVDMIFTLEKFCGHGYRRDDPDGQCYQGPGAELWFDFTCIHPNPTGHAVIADMFFQTIEE